MEATHHGPYMERPLIFVELGSNEKFWEDKKGGFMVARSLIGGLKKFKDFISTKKNYNEKNTVDNKKNLMNKKTINDEVNEIQNKNEKLNIEKNENDLMNNKFESVFVVGGGHYNHVANKAMLNSNLAVGHICAKYNLEFLDESLIKQAMEKCNAKLVLLDWKGLGKEKQRILDILEKNDIEFKRSDKNF
jgi:D-tyrosyl-tRNA(Tyr) deacylase